MKHLKSAFDIILEKISASGVKTDYCIEANPDCDRANMILAIEAVVQAIKADYPFMRYKFGKTGNPRRRRRHISYRKSSYTNMFLLCRSTDSSLISFLEADFINRHETSADNVAKTDKHLMTLKYQHYWLYLVSH